MMRRSMWRMLSTSLLAPGSFVYITNSGPPNCFIFISEQFYEDDGELLMVEAMVVEVEQR